MHPALADRCQVDIIGDVHGCYEPLVKLLQRLGYQSRNGTYCHPERRAIFVGDLIDRGPMIRETLDLVYRMHQEGQALMVLGNHEYNAVRFREEIFQLLEAGEQNQLPERLLKLMRETLRQFGRYGDLWRQFTQWMSTLPLFLQGVNFRVVHACWDQQLVDRYLTQYPEDGINEDFIEASKVKGTLESQTVDRLTRGTSMPLPDGMQLQGKDGFIRRFFRTKFWAQSPETYADVVFQPDPLPYEVAENKLQKHHKTQLVHYGEAEPPVFFGHYWMKGRPAPLKDNIACLDYSAVNFGRLTAYTFRGEAVLTPEHFSWVYVDP